MCTFVIKKLKSIKNSLYLPIRNHRNAFIVNATGDRTFNTLTPVHSAHAVVFVNSECAAIHRNPFNSNAINIKPAANLSVLYI